MRQRKLVSLLIRSVMVMLFSAPVILLVMILQTAPLAPSSTTLSTQELARIEQFLLDATPQSPTATSEHHVHLNQEQLNLVFRYGIEWLALQPMWSSDLTLRDNQLDARMSVNVLSSSYPLYLNVHGAFVSDGTQLSLDSLEIGSLALPRFLLDMTSDRVINNLATSENFQDLNTLLSNITALAIANDSMDVTMLWEPQLISSITQQAQLLFISSEDQERITDYYNQLGLLAAGIPVDRRAISLNTLLVPLFQSALDKSRAGSDPVAENRTLLQTLAIYVNNEDIAQLLGSERAAELEPAKFIEVRLHRRQDLAQHVVSVAAISASAGAGLAELLSNAKEAYDARYRSGFSFSDLAANIVGVQIASYATQDEATALLMQERLASIRNESDYMPELGSNQDGLSESDFNAQYENRNSPEYRARIAEIQQLINARPLFQNLH